VYDSVSFIGHRVSTDGRFAVETHLLGCEIENVDDVFIAFIEKIRDNCMFPNLDELKLKIKQDIVCAKAILRESDERIKNRR
jgi:riboflavin kinase/FMN adenylyltransferase